MLLPGPCLLPADCSGNPHLGGSPFLGLQPKPGWLAALMRATHFFQLLSGPGTRVVSISQMKKLSWRGQVFGPTQQGEGSGSWEPAARGSLSSGKACSGPSKLGAWATCFLLGEGEGTGIPLSPPSVESRGRLTCSDSTSEQGHPTVSLCGEREKVKGQGARRRGSSKGSAAWDAEELLEKVSSS